MSILDGSVETTKAEPGFFSIQDSDLTSLKDKVVLITGGSSGIGLAAVKICVSLRAKVVVGDVNECPEKSDAVTFQKVDVTDWKQQSALFKKAIEVHGAVDHCFANAGIGPTDTFTKDTFDSAGELEPPNMKTMEINLNGPIFTSKLALHYLRKNPEGGSLVITASASSFTPFVATDYGVAKHGALGLMRNLDANLKDSNIRVNCITPLWTASGLVPAEMMKEHLGIISQPPEAAARSALLLMADGERRGQTMFSKRSMFKEIDSIAMKAMVEAVAPGPGDVPADEAKGKAFNEMFSKGS
ncbi:uncharacterized protein LTR77_002307 [Saxophila tyrrhenica]|uniref:Uncharacterized protein n=1 Tax=Saxophila tyrrhenica TaxID=1690608 RepID=A0AAV9PN03_9PEZI|nr:hypothetical protein LTR77_002307 [Saxophila tyrrhenica]